ncbi:MAG: extracellular solute-binding protein family 5, partial [Chloroflexi bacterium]|nr:extracellular solute-binding protein family 5 [Chloroflexota bacterium]
MGSHAGERSGTWAIRRPSRVTVAVLAVLGLTIVPAVGSSQSGMVAHAAGDAGTLSMVADYDPADIDPAADQLAGSNNIQRNVYDQLTSLKGSAINDVVPSLATRWTSNANKSTWTFYLRQGVKFHTGHELTADDVKFSIGRTIKAGLAGSFLYSRFITNPDKQIKVINKYTVEFDLGSPQPLFLASTDNEYVGAIVDSIEVKKHIVKNDYGHAWLANNDAGTGPYTIKSWQHGTQVTLVKFPQYWGGWSGKHFSKVIFQTIPEGSTRRQMLERGTADLTFNLNPQDNAALSKEAIVNVDTRYTTEVQYMFMTEAGPLASPLARQAMSYAFNYNAYLQAAYKGFARRAYGPIPSVLLGYDPNMFHYQTDLNKAKQLFAQAGVAPGTTFTLVHANFFNYNIAAGILQAQLAQIGYVLKTTSLDEAAYNNIYYKTEPAKQHPNLLTFSWWPDFNDPYDMALPLISSKSWGSAGANAGYYKNATVDKLMSASANADKQTLIRNFKTIQDITG